MAAYLSCKISADSNVPVPNMLNVKLSNLDKKSFDLPIYAQLSSIKEQVKKGLRVQKVTITIDFSKIKGLNNVKYSASFVPTNVNDIERYLKNSVSFAKDTYNKLYERTQNNRKIINENKVRLLKNMDSEPVKSRLRSNIENAQKDLNNISGWLSDRMNNWNVPQKPFRG